MPAKPCVSIAVSAGGDAVRRCASHSLLFVIFLSAVRPPLEICNPEVKYENL
jgi:hypothetical protein